MDTKMPKESSQLSFLTYWIKDLISLFFSFKTSPIYTASDSTAHPVDHFEVTVSVAVTISKPNFNWV
jgi:hypothetical protein